MKQAIRNYVDLTNALMRVHGLRTLMESSCCEVSFGDCSKEKEENK